MGLVVGVTIGFMPPKDAVEPSARPRDRITATAPTAAATSGDPKDLGTAAVRYPAAATAAAAAAGDEDVNAGGGLAMWTRSKSSNAADCARPALGGVRASPEGPMLL